MTPTARTLARLRKDGWTVDKVEWHDPRTHRTHDLFNCIDILALKGKETLGVQATAGRHTSHRMEKMAGTPEMIAWLDAGHRLEIWSWRQLKLKRGESATVWEPQITIVTFELLLPAPLPVE